MKIITADQLVCMNDYEVSHPLRIDLAYARDDNLLLGEAIYRADARLWLYQDLAEIVLSAAKAVHDSYGYRMVIYDGLRTVEAQARMLETKRVRDNPHWLEPPRLLSPPGAGGHPRGMAVDVSLEDADGALLDMGTSFDFLAEDSSPKANPAHRDHPSLSEEVIRNRKILDDVLLVDDRVVGLPQEWWDFRAPAELYNEYAPLSDEDLPPEMRMVL